MTHDTTYAAAAEKAQTLHGLQQLYRTVEYGHNWVYVRPDSPRVSANFKDIEDYKLLSPAFVKPETVPDGFPKGTAAPTSNADMEYFLKDIASRNSWMKCEPADYKSEEGRNILHVLLSADGQNSISTMNRPRKLKVWIQAAVHGNEPAGDQSIVALIAKMEADETWARSILDAMDIFIIPRYNPDGVETFQRFSASNLDLNRDHIKLASQQTRDIKMTFNAFAPHIAIDVHEFSAPAYYAGSYVHASDALFSAAKNLNIDPDVRSLSEELFAVNVGTALQKIGLRWEAYITGTTIDSTVHFAEASSDGKIGRNAMGMTQTVAFLCEARGIGIADQHFQRRTVASLTIIESILQTAAENAERVYQTITKSVENFIHDNREIIISDSAPVTERLYRMVNFNTGNIIDLPVRFASTTPTTPKLTRVRPEAYIIPRDQADIAGHMRALGLKVVELAKGFQGHVEVLNISSVTYEDTYHEGIAPVTVVTTSVHKNIVLPSGGFSISTRQRSAALAFVALEPENVDSLVASNLLPVRAGEEYPIYRLLRHKVTSMNGVNEAEESW